MLRHRLKIPNPTLALVFAWALCASLLSAGAPSARAANAPYGIAQNELIQDFPKTLTFSLKLENARDVRAIRLSYGSNTPSCNTGVAKAPAKFDQGARITATWEWDLKTSALFTPGAEVWWQWEITDAAGGTTQTERVVTRIIDARHRWQAVSNDRITVNWVQGNNAFGKKLLTIADASLTDIEQNYGVTATRAIQIWVYPDTRALQETLAFSPEWTGGVASPAHNAVLTSINAGQIDSWGRIVLPHEITHLIVGARMFNCGGAFLPTWLNEGLAVFSEPDERDTDGLKRALEDRRILSLRSLAGEFASDPEAARQSYAYSGAIVAFLVEKGGAAKMSALLTAVRGGATIDESLQRVYGFDTDGLDQAWRTDNGVRRKPILAVKPTATPATRSPRPRRTPAPTLAPFDPNATQTP